VAGRGIGSIGLIQDSCLFCLRLRLRGSRSTRVQGGTRCSHRVGKTIAALATKTRYGVGLGAAVPRSRGVTSDLGVGVNLGVAVGLPVGVGVVLATGVGVGLPRDGMKAYILSSAAK
jgi:hypothetical protein